MTRALFLTTLGLLALSSVSGSGAEPMKIGLAEIDITPDYPIRLHGFGFRREESEGVRQKVSAKALVIVDGNAGPAVLITVDNLGIPKAIRAEVAKRLAAPMKLRPDRLTITATHTHCAPMLEGVAPTIFGTDIPEPHRAHIAQYTREFTTNLVKVALAAHRNAEPATLEWVVGKAGFAKNRRTPGGPVDHDLPMLLVRGIDHSLRGVWFSYACHCTTLSDNLIDADWAGYAQTQIQAEHPGVIALASIGCGADANPEGRDGPDKVAVAKAHGQAVARNLTFATGRPISAPLEISSVDLRLPFDAARTRQEWDERAKKPGAVGYHAGVNLARLERGETLPDGIDYSVQTWRFGKELALVFLPGEVVVDYSLRLKQELDPARVAIIAYSNDAPCYIPSERILREGGYEGGDAMIYYDLPQRFAPGLEQKIVDSVEKQLPDFKRTRGTEGSTPKPPDASLKSIRTRESLRVELVAAEPLVQSPVAIDWDAKGRLWVCEMFDYPTGLDEKWKPGGRIKILDDRNGDGTFDTATIFLEGLPFPTGVTAWRDGALICAAPDILYAHDTNGDGKADQVEKLFTGFETNNYQARVNGFALGLDNWLYGANGLLGGKITGKSLPAPLDLRGHDFRFQPDAGRFEAVAGLTQHGRIRDDWDHWFGCENSRPLFQFPLADHYAKRNPAVAGPKASIDVIGGGEARRIFPISAPVERFNHPESAGFFTSACGIGIYRDTLLGDEFAGNAFVCEPVHNVVHRVTLQSDGITFAASRANDEKKREFFASSDLWSRPVQVRTGPDGALYVVDMYRFLIEHPRWIEPERLAKIDARAGAERGRIYRIVAKDKPLRRIADLTALGATELAAALDTPNGTERDRVHASLLWRNDKTSAPRLAQIARESPSPAARAQALSALDGLAALDLATTLRAMHDADPRVRANSVRVAEQFLRDHSPDSEELRTTLFGLITDPDRGVRYRVALALGECDDLRAGQALATLSRSDDVSNPYFANAIASSSPKHALVVAANAAPTPRLAAAAKEDLARLSQKRNETSARRAEIIARYRDVATTPDGAVRGAAVFARACATCHLVGGVGHAVGPDLLPLASKPADYFVQHILDPNAAIEPRYSTYLLQMRDGRALAGIISGESGTSVTVVAPGGTTENVLKKEITQIDRAEASLMPEGLENMITPQEMGELVAFLRAAR
jgi:putative membrane-bound dehydrogenase-like protein